VKEEEGKRDIRLIKTIGKVDTYGNIS